MPDEGGQLSMRTSEAAAILRKALTSAWTSRKMLSLPLSQMRYAGSVRMAPPPSGMAWMTRAPLSARNIVAMAPAGPSVRSSTVMPSSALGNVFALWSFQDSGGFRVRLPLGAL